MKNPLIYCAVALIVAFSGTVPQIMLLLAAGFVCSAAHAVVLTAGVTVFKACLLLCSFWLCCQLTVKRNLPDNTSASDMCKK